MEMNYGDKVCLFDVSLIPSISGLKITLFCYEDVSCLIAHDTNAPIF